MMAPRTLEEIRECLLREASDPEGDLASAALWIAAEEYPDLDRQTYLDYLDRLADRIATTRGDGETGADPLAEHLYGREGFRGNTDDYYDPRNSYLNDVIDRRTGIPITLAVVYLSVARRLGREAAGLNTPGHFLVLDRGAVIDPFDAAQPIDRKALLARFQDAGVSDPSSHLDWILHHPADTRSILARMLVNLRANHLRRGDVQKAVGTVDRLLRLDAGNPAWLRDRGALLQRLDCPAAAAADLEAYLERAPDDPEADVIRQLIARLNQTAPPLQ